MVRRSPGGGKERAAPPQGPAHRRPGNGLAFDRELYKARNVVERCFNRLKQFRAIATRFDELATRYKAGVHLAALILWLREPARDSLSDRS
ncbi:transposase [Streptomyces sp. DSM 40712]|uniref:Transposase n=1 Tax=Streptomyces lancefieldiae TaxID=3075520 RepID=A0ABU3B2T7_9ACTN|nr:transposase [Streptomyces sp. DSM 40712]MDT0616440.1 transposase [Streptomyces sp. DSM 40712]